MAASTEGATESVLCDFSKLGGSCGNSQHYISSVLSLDKIADCNKGTTHHLQRLNSSESTAASDFPEGLLILYRSGIFTVDLPSINLRICPKHRDIYGIYWLSNRTKCQYPGHPSSSKAKADRGATPLMCKQYWLSTRQLIPVGIGKRILRMISS